MEEGLDMFSVVPFLLQKVICLICTLNKKWDHQKTSIISSFALFFVQVGLPLGYAVITELKNSLFAQRCIFTKFRPLTILLMISIAMSKQIEQPNMILGLLEGRRNFHWL